MPPEVDNPPDGFVTITINEEEIFPEPEVPFTEVHEAQSKRVESQRGFARPLTLTIGMGFTETVAVEVFTHPFPSVPVMVKVEVKPGLAVTVVPVVALNPIAGAQTKELAPEAVKLTVEPLQMEGANGVTEIVGNGYKVTVTVAVPTPQVVHGKVPCTQAGA